MSTVQTVQYSTVSLTAESIMTFIRLLLWSGAGSDAVLLNSELYYTAYILHKVKGLRQEMITYYHCTDEIRQVKGLSTVLTLAPVNS